MLTKNHSKQFFLILFFSLLSFLFSSQVLAAEPVDDLDIGIWHFDETDNVNAEDFSSYNHDLVWMHNPWGMGKVFPPRARGKFDMGINFTQNEERYGLENFGSIDLSSGITLGAWIKTEVNTDEKVRILWLGNYRDSRVQDPSNFIMLSVQNGQVHLDLKQDKEWEREIVSGKIVNDNEWHFLTVTLDPDTQKMTLYVDGQYQAESSFDLPIPILEMLSIGMREYYFDSGILNNSGVIDDVWLRQEPLNEEKINNIFQSGQAYKFDTLNYDLVAPSVFVNYDFDHINGTVALDSSANHYDIFWGYNMYSPGASPTPRLVPGKFDQGVNFKKDWETYSRKFDPIKNFSQGFSSGIWIKTNEINELPARIFWTGTEPKGRMDEVAYSDYLAVTEVDGKIKVDLNFYDGYFESGQIMFKRQYSLNSKTFISDDTWHHIAVTLDSRPNVHTMKLYIDGILEDTSFFPGLIPPVDKLALGHREYPACGVQYNFNGTEDDFFIMNSVISDKDVKDIYESNSAFTWPIRKRNPVIIVPGIMGSWKKHGEWTIDPIMHTYDNLINAMRDNGYEIGNNLFILPYDWRQDNVKTALELKELISWVKDNRGVEKVDIVAHSMGGLVSRYYVQSNSYQNDVDKLIFLDTPHQGSPESYLIYEGGVFSGAYRRLEQKIFHLEAIESGYFSLVKYIKEKVKSVEQLLPVFNYLQEKYNGVWIDRIYPVQYPRNIFLEELNEPEGLNLLRERVDITNIISFTRDLKTLNKIKVVSDPDIYDNKWTDGYPDDIEDGDFSCLVESLGDSTVPADSLRFLSGVDSIEISDSKHQEVVTKAQRNVIKILTGIEPENYREGSWEDVKNILFVRVYSPVDFVVISPDGKRMGKDFDTNVEFDEVDGAFYSGFDSESEFVTILNPIEGEYKVGLRGADVGEYKISISNISEENEKSVEFVGEINDDENRNFDFTYIKTESENTISELVPQDTIPPVINIVTPIDRQKYLHSSNMIIDYLVIDDFSGVSSTAIYIDDVKVSTTSIDLLYYKIGQHVLTIDALDNSGNESIEETNFEIFTNIQDTINVVKRMYKIGWITNWISKELLVTQLFVIDKGVAIFQKQEEQITKQKNIISGNDKLKEKNKTRLLEEIEKRLERLKKQESEFVTRGLENVDKTLNRLYDKKLINQSGYDIIKSNIEYLKSNIVL